MKDILGKHFLQFFGVLTVMLGLLFDSMFFFIQYPERNHDIINVVTGVINTSMIGTVISFFYGSSKGSKDAADFMRKEKEKPDQN